MIWPDDLAIRAVPINLEQKKGENQGGENMLVFFPTIFLLRKHEGTGTSIARIVQNFGFRDLDEK